MHSDLTSNLGHTSTIASEARKTPSKALVAFGTLVLAGYWVLAFNTLRVDWSINPQYYFGWFVPLLALGLFRLRWNGRPPAAAPADTRALTALALVAFAALLPIRLIEEANPEWRLIQWAHAAQMVLLTLCALYYVGGWPWTRHFFFPVAFLLVAVPWPVSLEGLFVQNLMRVVAGITVEVVGFFNIPAVQHGNIIQISAGLVGIDEACSGVRSLQTALFVCLFLGELYRFSLARRFALLFAGFAIALACNVGRTFFLVWEASHHGLPRMHAVHDTAGALVLVGTLTLVWVVAQVFRWTQVHVQPAHPPSEVVPLKTSANATAIPSSCRVLSGRLLFGLFLWALVAELMTQSWYRAHETTAVDNARWSINWPDPNGHTQEIKIDDMVKSILRYTEGRQQVWQDASGNQWQMFFFRWAPGRNSAQLASAHTPDICLRGLGYRLTDDLGFHGVPVKDITLPFHQYLFVGGTVPLHVFYCRWEDQLTPQLPNLREDGGQMSRLRAVLAGHRHLGQQVVEVTLSGPETSADAFTLFENQISRMIQR